MNTNRISIAAAAALLAASPLAASAAQTAYAVAPVTIASVTNESNFVSLPYGAQRLYLAGLGVAFVNRTNVAAKDVTFAVTRDGKTETVTEHGSYAPDTRVELQLGSDSSTVFAPPAATVTIASVDFADGSTWTPATGIVASR